MPLTMIIEKAKAAGFETTAQLSVDTLRFMPEVRDMCKADRCHQYNHCWTCPPACGSLTDCAEKARKYKDGVLLQTVGEIEDSFDYQGFKRVEALHKQRLLRLVETLRSQELDFLPMGAGACTICTDCTFPESPCRHPEKAMISMEAFGLWVSEVCKKNNVPYNYGENKIAYTSCILAN
jgi:predicted metal-binding protein